MFANTAKTILANTTLRDARLADAARFRLRGNKDEYNIKAENVFIVDDDSNPSRSRRSRNNRKSDRKSTRKTERKTERKNRTNTCNAAAAPTERRKRVRQRQSNVPEETFYSTTLKRGLRDAVANDAATEPAEHDHLMDNVLHDDDHYQLSDCQYHDTDDTTLADKEPTDTQAATINRLNKRFLKFEASLRQKYRAFYSPRAERGYVVRKFVGNTDKVEHYGDAMLKYRPIGIGGKTLERVWKARHGFDWSEFATKTKSDSEVESLISEHAWETAKSKLNKAEAKALRERAREEARKAQQQAAKARERAERADNHADVQANEAKQANARAKKATATATKQPTSRNRAAAKQAQRQATMERQEANKARERAKQAERKARKAEKNAEQKNDEKAARAKVLEKLANKYT